MNEIPPILVGLTSYNDAPLLERVLPQLVRLKARFPMTIVVVNNGLNDDVSLLLKTQFPDVLELKPEFNLGFGGAYNRLLKTHPEFEIVYITTNDVWVNEAGFEFVLKSFLEDETLAAAAGKLHAWNLATDERTDVIDSLGIRAQKRHYFYDWAQGEVDQGQYDERLDCVFGLSGASFFVRRSAIAPLFEEDMFMYKEDIDLAYRLRWQGSRIRVFPVVLGWHARGAANRGDRSALALVETDGAKSTRVRRLSYSNHFRLLKRNWAWGFGGLVFARTLAYEFMKAGYLLFRDPKTLILGLRTLLFERVKPSNKRVPPCELLQFFD